MPPREKEFDAVCLVIDVGVTSAASGFLNSALRYMITPLRRQPD